MLWQVVTHSVNKWHAGPLGVVMSWRPMKGPGSELGNGWAGVIGVEGSFTPQPDVIFIYFLGHLCLPSCKARSLTSWNSYRILIEEASHGMLLTTGSSLHTIISILGVFLSPFSRSAPLLWLASELLVFFRGCLQKNHASHVSNFLGFVLDITAGPSGFF